MNIFYRSSLAGIISVIAGGATMWGVTPTPESGPLSKVQIRRIESILTNDSLRSALQNSQAIGVLRQNTADPIINMCIEGDCGADLLRAAGVAVNELAGGIYTARVPASMIPQLQNVEGIRSVSPARKLNHLLDAARNFSNVNDAHAGINTGLDKKYDGAGVVIGIVDNGFELNHIAFMNPDRKTSRIARVWNQQVDTIPELAPKGYNYGIEYTPNEAGSYDVKTDTQFATHGSHVAGIAAGLNPGSGFNYYGVAPGAEIVLVSFNGYEGGALDGIKYIFDYAAKVGKPCVINLSIGSNLGPHDGTSLADRAIDAMVGPGRIVVGAAGNSGQYTPHFSKTFTPTDNTASIGVQFKYSISTIGALELWGERGQKPRLTIDIIDRVTNHVIASSKEIEMSENNQETVKIEIPVSDKDPLVVTAAVTTGTEPANNRPFALVDLMGRNSGKDKYTVAVTLRAVDGTVHGWIDDTYSGLTNLGIPGFSRPDSFHTISELGGTGNEIISVGAYTTKNSFTVLGGGTGSTGYTIRDMAPFTSLGPTVDNRMKPDISAPGSTLVSAYNRYYGAFKAENMVTYFLTPSGSSCYYGTMSGTSMSAPFVSGAMALWLQANPSLTPQEAKSVLAATAIKDQYTADQRRTGYGKIDVTAGLRKINSSSGVRDLNSDSTSALSYTVDNEGFLTLQLASPASVSGSLTIYNAAGMATNTVAIPAGETSVSVQLTKGISMARITVDGKRPETIKIAF